MKEKILLDTDIGTDIDDAVCLAYLLSHPECDLMGITTVSGEPVKRAMMASAMCKVAKQQVPIYPGVAEPLLAQQRAPVAPQARALDRWEHETKFPEGEAIEFLRRTIRENPGEITLLAIGPMTNIGLLFAADPEIPGLLKQLVLMCGVFTNLLPGVGPLEYNAVCDPHATAMVYRTPAAVHRSIGLDVTMQVSMSSEEVFERFQTDILKPVVDFSRVWFEQANGLTFHDPLAAATIFDPGICSFTKGNVDVELSSEKLAGLTYWTAEEAGKHQVALTVDRERFLEHYFSIVK